VRYFESQSGNEKSCRKDSFNRKLLSKKIEKKKDARREQNSSRIPKKPKVYKNQMGFEFLSQKLGFPIPEDLLNSIEKGAAVLHALSQARNLGQASSILFLYFKTYYNRSIISDLFKYLSDDCDIRLIQDGSEDESEPDWLQILRGCKDDLSKVTKWEGFTKVSRLISMCSALGLCSLAKFDLTVSGIRVFSIPAYQKHVKASDLMSAVIDTVVYFVEGGYECFKQGAVSFAYFGDKEARQFNEDYYKVLENSNHVKTGNLQRFSDMTENDYDLLLTRTIESAEKFLKSSSGSWEQKIFSDRVTRLRSLRADFNVYRCEGKLREAPFTVYIEGPSGVGKSSVSQIVMRSVLLHNGFEASDERLIALNDSDKFDSTYKSFINGVFMDDVHNTKLEFVEKAPTQKIIQICNNVPHYANVAEADMKGKVTVEPRCVVMTSNVPFSVVAHDYSNCGESILRRAHVHLEVRVKPEYRINGTTRLDSEKVIAAGLDSSLPDIWEISARLPLSMTGNAAIFKDAFTDKFCQNGTEQTFRSISEVLEQLFVLSRRHYAEQKFVVEANSNLDLKLKFCQNCNKPAAMCKCLEKQMGIDTQFLFEAVDSVCKSRFMQSVNWMPGFVFENSYVQNSIAYLRRYEIFESMKHITSFCQLFLLTSICSVFASPLACFSGIFASCYIYIATLFNERDKLIERIKRQRDAMPELFKRVRDNKRELLLSSCVVFGAIYFLIKLFKTTTKFTYQGNLSPTNIADIDLRDAEKNPWSNPVMTELPVIERNTSFSQLTHLVKRNLLYFRILNADDGVPCSDAFFVGNNLALIPQHMWIKDELEVQFCKYGAENLGGDFKCIISKKLSYNFVGQDLSLVYIPSGGEWRDLISFFPTASVPGALARIVYRRKDGTFLEETIRTDYARTINTATDRYDGYLYQMREQTFNGLCMATLIAETRIPFILGFHLAGAGREGAAGYLTQQKLLDAITELKKNDSILISKSSGVMPTKLYDVQFFKGDELSPRSPVNFLENGGSMRVFGSCEGKTTNVSSLVTKTPISPLVEEVMGVPCIWGAPKFAPKDADGNRQFWKPWRDTLINTSRPSAGLPPLQLEWAVKDYLKPVLYHLEHSPSLRKDIRPLTEMETLCGVDGKRFLDKIVPSTSAGYPLTGPKSAYITYLDPEHYPEFNCPAELDKKFLVHAEEMELAYLRGERAYPIFKACLKDEPTKLSKDKVRVFQGAPLAFQLLVRKYFLPVCRHISMHPLLFECAVGVNAQGPEWDQLVRYMKKYGDNMLAGDYGKYDTRMPAQINLASFKVLISIAQVSLNYTSDDLKIMEGIATDICYPVTAYNGDLLQFLGTSPSGHNLTVYINSIGNSLMLRCAFCGIYPKKNIAFRDVASMMTYGDDCNGSVNPNFSQFNIVNVSEYFAKHDIVFTMPDKQAELQPYLHFTEVDFLKRKAVWNEELGLFVGPLDENSIFKSLHTVLKSKAVSLREQSACNIDGALREWFAHGRETYELRRQQLRKVAEESDLTGACRELDITYDDRITAFKEKYLSK
jgi:hypothetical protein